MFSKKSIFAFTVMAFSGLTVFGAPVESPTRFKKPEESQAPGICHEKIVDDRVYDKLLGDTVAMIEYIHQRVLSIDTHVDTPLRLLRSNLDLTNRNLAREGGGKLDFRRMDEGGLDAVFFAVFLGQGSLNEAAYEEALRRALEIFETINSTMAKANELAGLALKPSDAFHLKRNGKKAVYLGVENAYPLGMDINLVDKFYHLGARYIGLSHTLNNQICDSSTDHSGPIHNGLSEFGKEVVKRMNELGMMVDVSHISDKAVQDVLEITTLPIIASHSNARAICDHPRNLSDDLLVAIAKNGGVVQVCLLSAYVKILPPDPERDQAMEDLRKRHNNFQDLTDEQMEAARNDWFQTDRKFPGPMATVADLVDHIDHIVKVAGIDHVGIGTDFDGGGALIDCYDVSELKNITRELLRRGYTFGEIEKIWGGNFMRVFEANQNIAK